MNNKNTPVCIIGAGPAGFTTAFHLAKVGIKSIILDKDISPRTKPCADILTSISLRELRKLFPKFTDGLEVSKRLANSKGVIIHAPNYHQFTMEYLPEKGEDVPLCYALKRSDLDVFLTEQARANPLIELIEQFNVKKIHRENGIVTLSDNKGRSVETPLVIVAAGSNAPLAGQLTGEKKDFKHFAVGVRAYFKNVKMPQTSNCELFIREKMMPGAFYIAPFYDDTMNVNMVMRSDVVKKKKINIKELFLKMIQEDPDLKERFKDAEMIGEIQGSGLKLGTKTRKASGDNFILTGDSAGLIDILSANGLPQAFLSGRLAAEFAQKAILANDYSAQFTGQFDEILFDAVDKYVKTGKLIAPFMDKSWYNWATKILINFFAKRMQTNDALRDLLMYDSDAKHTILKPSFYLKIFFRSKNPDAESHLVS